VAKNQQSSYDAAGKPSQRVQLHDAKGGHDDASFPLFADPVFSTSMLAGKIEGLLGHFCITPFFKCHKINPVMSILIVGKSQLVVQYISSGFGLTVCRLEARLAGVASTGYF
jgi:hypothetical protein